MASISKIRSKAGVEKGLVVKGGSHGGAPVGEGVVSDPVTVHLSQRRSNVSSDALLRKYDWIVPQG